MRYAKKIITFTFKNPENNKFIVDGVLPESVEVETQKYSRREWAKFNNHLLYINNQHQCKRGCDQNIRITETNDCFTCYVGNNHKHSEELIEAYEELIRLRDNKPQDDA